MSQWFNVQFVHPLSKEPLILNGQGDLCWPDNPGNALFVNEGGSFDFAAGPESEHERAHYGKLYRCLSSSRTPIELSDLRAKWREESALELLFQSLGRLGGGESASVG